jgi:two-component system sensor histidine kinase BarA
MADAPNIPSGPPAGQADDERPPFDVNTVIAMCGGDRGFATAIMEKFRATAGRETAEIEQALARGDAPALRRAAHGLKGMAAYLSAQRVSELSQQIEFLARDNRLADVSVPFDALQQEIARVLAWIDRYGGDAAEATQGQT